MMIDLLILCEGITDQSLLGCYIEDVSEWKYCNNIKNNPFAGEDITWYRNVNGHLLGIWSNGGDDFENNVLKICNRELYENSIGKFLIITDNDDENAGEKRLESIYRIIKKKLRGTFEQDGILINQYNRFNWNSYFGEAYMEIGYLLVPLEGHGALESFMLSALSENLPEQKEVIDQVKSFLNNFESDVYLKHRRDRVKAELGVSISIMNPDKSFVIMKELIDTVKWSEFQASFEQFRIIRESL